MKLFNKMFGKFSLAGLAFIAVLFVVAIGVMAVVAPQSVASVLLLLSGIGLVGMAVTTQKSTQETNRTAVPQVQGTTQELHGRIRIAYFNFTQSGAGDANSLVNLVTLPPGKVRLLKPSSVFICSAFGAARTLDIGFLAHTKLDGTAVAASIDTILDGADVSAAAGVACGADTNGLGTDPTILFDSKEGVTIQAKVLGDTIPDAATLKGYFQYVVD